MSSESSADVWCTWCDEYKRPRSTSAVTEDRKFLVVLHEPVWIVYEDRVKGYIPRRDAIADTGQDAAEVLASWLEARS